MRRLKEPAIQTAAWLLVPVVAAGLYVLERIGRRL